MNIRRLFDGADRKERRGTNAVEFALTAPILFFLILATMDFGWYFAHWLTLEGAVVHGARVAALLALRKPADPLHLANLCVRRIATAVGSFRHE